MPTFEKVSFTQFVEAWQKVDDAITTEQLMAMYEQLKLPKRATTGSAGYDFFAPRSITIPSQAQVLIPSGIRAKMSADLVLLLFPRSGLGFKYRLQLNNTIGVIDSDYVNADNEGHIFARLCNDTKEGKTVTIAQGDGMFQGVFIPFVKTDDDQADQTRVGGLGSTTKKE